MKLKQTLFAKFAVFCFIFFSSCHTQPKINDDQKSTETPFLEKYPQDEYFAKRQKNNVGNCQDY